MANSDIPAFPGFGNIQDDSTYVHQAMQSLGFCCEFYELPLPDMQLALGLALHLKRSQGQPELWES